jgi:hypothetical protein
MQVMAKQFEVVRVLALTAPGFSKRDAYVAISGLVDKVSMALLKNAVGWTRKRDRAEMSWLLAALIKSKPENGRGMVCKLVLLQLLLIPHLGCFVAVYHCRCLT